MRICLYLFFTLLPVICSSQSRSAERKQKAIERKKLDSLILSTTLPVNIRVDSFQVDWDLVNSVEESLIEKKFELVSDQKSTEMFRKFNKDFLFEEFGGSSFSRMKEFGEKAKDDKEYLQRKLQKEPPYLQHIVFERCIDSLPCVRIRRYNMPNARESRTWLFQKLNTETQKGFASRIVDSLVTLR